MDKIDGQDPVGLLFGQLEPGTGKRHDPLGLAEPAHQGVDPAAAHDAECVGLHV
ncbi:MAG: hypothetical protein ABI355_14460 [Solirubrobacteraceae bacterium]